MGSRPYPPTMSDVSLTFESLVEGLRGRAAQAHRVTFDDRLADLLVLVRAGERGIAVEHLCSNLYEFQVPVTEREHAALGQFAARWGVAASTGSDLERLRPSSE